MTGSPSTCQCPHDPPEALTDCVAYLSFLSAAAAHRGVTGQSPTMVMTAIVTAATDAFVSSAQAADKKAKTPEQACQAQALASTAKDGRRPTAPSKNLKSNRLLVMPSCACCFRGQSNRPTTRWHRCADVFSDPKDSSRDFTYCGGKSSAECTWKDHLEAAIRAACLRDFAGSITVRAVPLTAQDGVGVTR